MFFLWYIKDMDRFKSVMLKVLSFIRTKRPIICVVVFGLCWAAYLINSDIHGHSIDNQPRSFWNTIKFISCVMWVNAWIFSGSFSVLMLIKPLPEKLKILRVFFRLLIALIVSVFFLGCSYISTCAFVGFGG